MDKENYVIRICEHLEGKVIDVAAANAHQPFSGGISPKSRKEIAIFLCQKCLNAVENKTEKVEDIMLYGNED